MKKILRYIFAAIHVSTLFVMMITPMTALAIFVYDTYQAFGELPLLKFVIYFILTAILTYGATTIFSLMLVCLLTFSDSMCQSLE